jgi:hypothetical protein
VEALTEQSSKPPSPPHRRRQYYQSQSQSYFTTGGLPPISSSWRQAPWDSRPAFFFQLNSCFHSPYVTSSLARGWVCRLQLLMALVSSPAGLMTTFYSLKFETFPTWRARSPYLYPPGVGWPIYSPRHWVSFSSPRMTRRATVEVRVFDPTSTRDPSYSSSKQYCQKVGRSLWREDGSVVCNCAVILGSQFLGTHGRILLSKIRDFRFRRHLRLPGSRWRYSTPPPHGLKKTILSVLKIYLIHWRGLTREDLV